MGAAAHAHLSFTLTPSRSTCHSVFLPQRRRDTRCLRQEIVSHSGIPGAPLSKSGSCSKTVECSPTKKKVEVSCVGRGVKGGESDSRNRGRFGCLSNKRGRRWGEREPQAPRLAALYSRQRVKRSFRDPICRSMNPFGEHGESTLLGVPQGGVVTSYDSRMWFTRPAEPLESHSYISNGTGQEAGTKIQVEVPSGLSRILQE